MVHAELDFTLSWYCSYVKDKVNNGRNHQCEHKRTAKSHTALNALLTTD